MNIKIKRALEVFSGHKGRVTINAILSQIPQEIFSSLTGRQIGALMNVINNNYHRAKNEGFNEAKELSK